MYHKCGTSAGAGNFVANSSRILVLSLAGTARAYAITLRNCVFPLIPALYAHADSVLLRCCRAQAMPAACSDHAQAQIGRVWICRHGGARPKHAQSMPKPCPNHAQTMPKPCPNHAESSAAMGWMKKSIGKPGAEATGREKELPTGVINFVANSARIPVFSLAVAAPGVDAMVRPIVEFATNF